MTDMLDRKSTRCTIEQKESYFSKWIDDTDEATEKFIEQMKPTMERFKALKNEGYTVSIDIDERFDSDCFGERDVVIVLISLYAEKRLTGMPDEKEKQGGDKHE